MDQSFDKAFPKPSTAAWIEEIRKSVKEASELEKLIWNHEAGFVLNAFYREENLEELAFTGVIAAKPDANWEIRQPVYTHKIMAANQAALKALENGADSIEFRGDAINSERELPELFKNIHLDWIPVHYDFGETNVALVYLLLDHLEIAGYDTARLKGTFNIDPLDDLCRQGNFTYTQAETFEVLKAVLETGNLQLPGYRMLGINTGLLVNAGATPVQELAFGIAKAVDYLDWLTEKGFSPSAVLTTMHFNWSIGPEYFTEIAKFRAFRLLWASVCEEYLVKDTQPYINAQNSLRNKSIYDPHNNLLRSATEAMSAIIGGADAVTLNPYDITYKQPDEFSYRQSRNIQLILKEEAHLDKVADAGAGAYYIEILTNKIAEHAWDLFREIEREGGFYKALQHKMIQRHIEAAANRQKSAFQSGEKILVGINKYPNIQEKKSGEFNPLKETVYMKEELEVMPVREERIAESFEAARLKKEETEKTIQN